MNNYLLIESRDPFESNDVGYYYELSKGLVEAGNEVTLFLVQNGVLAARPSAPFRCPIRTLSKRSRCSRMISRCVSVASQS